MTISNKSGVSMSKRGITDKTRQALAEVAPKPAARPSRPRSKPSAPTPEQMAKADYVRRNSLTYRRQPLFETLAKTHDWISDDALLALRMYREWFEASNKSLTRCSLDVEGRGGGMPSGLPPIIGASFSLQLCRAAIGAIADVFDKVALEDKSFSDVAIERFGSRRSTWIQQPSAKAARQGRPAKFVEKIVPRSGRHREIIAHEFRAGLKRLVDMIATLNSNTRRLIAVPVALAEDLRDCDGYTTAKTDAESEAVDLAEPTFVLDPRFFNDRGLLRPDSEIVEILMGRDPDAKEAA